MKKTVVIKLIHGRVLKDAYYFFMYIDHYWWQTK